MEKHTWEITLADGSVITDLELNGNNFISASKLTEKDFAGKLSHVEYACTDGTIEEHDNMELVQVVKFEGKYWFVLRELTEAELQAIKTQAQIEYISMMADIDLEEV